MTAPSLASGLSPAGRNARSARPPLQGLSGADGRPRNTNPLNTERKPMSKPIKTMNPPAAAPAGPTFGEASRPLGETHVSSAEATLVDVTKES
jgi:hypothetical protein